MYPSHPLLQHTYYFITLFLDFSHNSYEIWCSNTYVLFSCLFHIFHHPLVLLSCQLKYFEREVLMVKNCVIKLERNLTSVAFGSKHSQRYLWHSVVLLLQCFLPLQCMRYNWQRICKQTTHICIQLQLVGHQCAICVVEKLQNCPEQQERFISLILSNIM